jgi:hypothetical protein
MLLITNNEFEKGRKEEAGVNILRCTLPEFDWMD